MLLTLYLIGVVWAILMETMLYFKMVGYCKENGLKSIKQSKESAIAAIMLVIACAAVPLFNYIFGISILLMKSEDFIEYMRKQYINGVFVLENPECNSYDSWAKYGYIYGPYRKDSFVNKHMNIQEEPHVEANVTTRDGSSKEMS